MPGDDLALCGDLRWKAHSQAAKGGPDLVAEVDANLVPYACLRTTMPWGPDGAPATPEGCGPDRPCYAQHGPRTA